MYLSKYRFFLYTPLLSAILLTACGNDNQPKEQETPAVAATETVELIPYQIVNQYPHDPLAFTEGLEYVNGFLYESTGQYGSSDVRKTELQSGKVLLQHKLTNKYFGEGLTILGDKLYQLTYQEKTGFVYDLNTLKPVQTFTFSTKEAWGMTNDGTHLIFGDGSDVLYFIDPATFQPVKQINVTDPYGPVSNINELEYIKGYIYANQWQTDNILKIDPKTGKVTGRADLATLRERTGIPPISGMDDKSPEVLNGIAYDAAGNRIFITGKFWPKIFEIKLDN